MTTDAETLIKLEENLNHLGEEVKLKADSDDIEGVHAMINEIYEKIHGL